MSLALRIIRLKAMQAMRLRGRTAQIIRCLFSPFAFYLCVSAKNAQIILVFFCGCFSSVSYASSPPATDVHICEVIDDEDMWARDSLYAAAKQALNVGEPRTVRMIYFLPNDRPFQQAVVDSMKVTIRQIQTFYAEQMEAHGYGRKTFRFETDAQGGAVVHRVDGQHPDSQYLDNTFATLFNEIRQAFDATQNIYFIVVDNSTNRIGQAAGSARLMGKNGGICFVPIGFHWTTAAHELGHTFDLRHNFNDDTYIMSYGRQGRYQLSACHAEFLSVHPYFNPDIPTEEAQPPTVELVSQTGYPAGSKSVSIQLRVSDSDGLHQVILFVTTIPPHSATGSYEVKSCRGLAGESDVIVEFDYDGVMPSDSSTSLSDPVEHRIYVEAVDSFGNAGNARFELFDISTRRNLIATFEEHTGNVYSVAFSPDGTTLASGASDPSIKLWDVATRTNFATRTRFTSSVYSVSFSPDGAILASGSGDTVAHLWEVATWAMITTLQGHTDDVTSVSFSPDGAILASGSEDRTIKLWDVATRTNIATLEGHTDEVTSVSFSSDGGILASGSWDDTVKLWDVATRANFATLEGHTRGVTSVSFSPDGGILASGSWDDTVKLWDVATRTNFATLTGHRGNVYSVSFSPDGGILASGSWDRTIKLWDVVTGTNIATFTGHRRRVTSVSFSPGGTILASGSWDDTIKLWDMSLYITSSMLAPASDFDGDGTVGFADFLQFVEKFGLSEKDKAYQTRFDLDGDGVVGFGDFLIFANNFGKKVS